MRIARISLCALACARVNAKMCVATISKTTFEMFIQYKLYLFNKISRYMTQHDFDTYKSYCWCSVVFLCSKYKLIVLQLIRRKVSLPTDKQTVRQGETEGEREHVVMH